MSQFSQIPPTLRTVRPSITQKEDVNYDDISSDRVSLLLQPSDALRIQLD